MKKMRSYRELKFEPAGNMLLVFFLLVFAIIGCKQQPEPTLFIIGDSTVRNGQGDGRDGLWG